MLPFFLQDRRARDRGGGGGGGGGGGDGWPKASSLFIQSVQGRASSFFKRDRRARDKDNHV